MNERKYSDNEVMEAVYAFPELGKSLADVSLETFFELRGEDFLPTNLTDVADGIAWFKDVDAAVTDFVENNRQLLVDRTYPIAESFIDEKRREPKLIVAG